MATGMGNGAGSVKIGHLKTEKNVALAFLLLYAYLYSEAR